jgi:hypothetical protein
VQTFLPYPDFAQTAQVLSRQHLGCQRKEAKQILSVLLTGKPGTGWYNHIVVRMWRGHETALALYGQTICKEWRRRGYKDSQLEIFEDHLKRLPPLVLPSWIGGGNLHSSYRAALLAKNSEWYGQFGWQEQPVIDYAWPFALLHENGSKKGGG